MARVILSFFLFVIITAIPPVLLIYTGHANWLVPRFWLIFFFISMLTFITVFLVNFVGKINYSLYTQTFLAATTVKILAAMFFALFFLMKIKPNNGIFLVNFFYVYFLNIAFEIYGLLCTLRNQKLK
ncbi:hypothetical protein [Mucilaginibacter gossypii]|uniref:hypothetical protein n=1 Tax=Mucilaginibacter gossypii TaxID=551996 RepID=UPI00116006F1|nr:hypothetical protein [Mucilaginibacter gossypii]